MEMVFHLFSGVMARAGMALRRGTNHGNTDGSDDVQRSIELLDRVLSEFDDVENANQISNIISAPTSQQVTSNANPGNVASTPDDESPSLGHQSEDDGYMSMNGRKPKFTLAFKPLTEENHPVVMQAQITPGHPNDFPPPPEEAEKLIATLLPKVSPAKRSCGKRTREFPLTRPPGRSEAIPPPIKFQNNTEIATNGYIEPIHIATQTTLPKTRHQRPYGWERNFNLQAPPPPPNFRFGSLPFQHPAHAIASPTRVPPRTNPTAIARHREVRRHGSEDNVSGSSDLEEPAHNNLRPLSELADDEHFSDDSLEEMLPPPPPPNKRNSIAWEVPLDADDPLLTPGSTKVIGRRRRKSGSYSSTSSIPNRLKELDEWPDPPPSTEDDLASPFSDSDEHAQLPFESTDNANGTGTYVIRRGKNRTSLLNSSVTSNSSLNSRLSSDLSIPHTRFSVDLNARLSTELHSPHARHSADLSGSAHSRLSHELHSPKSRYSLDLNNAHDVCASPSHLTIEGTSSRASTPLNARHVEFRKHSTTFDNIKSLIRDGVIESAPLESTGEFVTSPSAPSPIVRVVSLPSLSAEELQPRRELGVTVEEEEDTESPQQANSADVSPLRKIEQSISELLERRDIEVSSVVQDDRCVLQVNGVVPHFKEKRAGKGPSSKGARESRKSHDLQKSSSHSEIQRSEDYYRQLLIDGGSVQHYPKRNGIQKSESAKEMLIAHRERELRPMTSSSSADFPLKVEVLQHEFPPLPPSPVEEDDDEYSEIGQQHHHHPHKMVAHALTDAPPFPPGCSSLKTRSMDAGYNRGRRGTFLNISTRNIPPERRTLPTELQGPRRRTYQKRSATTARDDHHLQTSCSLPETPIFARGCDIPRTPHRKAPDVPRQSSTMSSLNTIGNLSTGGGYRRTSGLEQAIAGAEILRLSGGPARGWYPKHRQMRPASIEHLDRLTPGNNPWDSTRKPLTLPPNLTPKFFQRSPRDALRRVTSLLIRKGTNGKEPKKEVGPSKYSENPNGEEVQKKKGFFKNFWKRSRHYSLEQQQQQQEQ